ITTNPAILEKDSQRCTLSNLNRLCRIGEDMGVQEMQFQAWGDSAQSMVSVALDLFGMNPNLVVVKLPSTLEGFQAAALLRESAVRITMTAMYNSSQVLLAQCVGAEYAAPYLGRMNDAYGNNQGYKEVVQMQRILSAQKARTRLLVASIRDAFTMASLAAEGCDTFTISPSVASKLFKVTYTLDAVEQFEASARRMGAYDLENGATIPTLHLPHQQQQLASRSHSIRSPGTENHPPEGHPQLAQSIPEHSAQQEHAKRPIGEGRTPPVDDGSSASGKPSPSPGGSMNINVPAPSETDLAFGSHRISVVGPPMSHQRVELFSDGTVLTMSRPINTDHPSSPRLGERPFIESATPSGKSVVSSNPAPVSVPSSPTPAQTSHVRVGPLPGLSPPAVPTDASPGVTHASPPSRYSTPAVHTRPAWFAHPDPAIAYTHYQNSQGNATHISNFGHQAGAQMDSFPAVPPMNASPHVYTLHRISPHGAAASLFGHTATFGAMGPPAANSQHWSQPPPHNGVGPAAAPGPTQAFGSEQASSPADAGGGLFPSPMSPRPHGHTPERGPWPNAYRTPQQLQMPQQPNSTGLQAPPSFAAAAAAWNAGQQAGPGTAHSANMPAAMTGPAAGLSPMASSSQGPSGSGNGGTAASGPSGGTSGTPPEELRNKYRKTKQLLQLHMLTMTFLTGINIQAYVKEIETLRERLVSEGRRAGMLGAQVAALQGQVEKAGDSAALLAATQAEKMVAAQKLREARERTESLQSQLAVAQAQVRVLEQQQAGMLGEFATERQRREAQIVEERQKLEAARAEEQSQKMAYLAAFHEDRERWEAAVAEKERTMKAAYEEKIATAKEEHQRLMATAAAQHEAALKEARAEAQAATEAANQLIQRIQMQAQATADAAEEAVLDARVQMQLAEAEAAKRAKIKAQAATEAAEAAVQKARAECEAAAASAAAEVQEAWAAARAEIEARDAALAEARRQHAEELEAVRRRHAEELEIARMKHLNEMEETRVKHAAEMEEVRTRLSAGIEEARTRHTAEMEDVRAKHSAEMEGSRKKQAAEVEEHRVRHVKQLAEAEDALSRRAAEVRSLGAQLAEVEAKRVEAATAAAAKAAQLQDLELQIQSLRTAVGERDSQLQTGQAALAAAQAAAAAVQQEAAQKLQARNQEVASENASRLAAAEARLEEAPRRVQERVDEALRQAQEAHRQQLSGAVQRVQQDAAAKLLEVQSATNVANEALTNELEVQLESTRREVERITGLLESRSSEIRSLCSSLEQVSQERDKLVTTAAELQDMVIKVQQRMEKQEKKHAKALERAQAHREQQVARLQEELEAIRASVPGRVESALQVYASQLAANHQAAVAAVEARAAAALAAEHTAAEAALKRAHEEAEKELQLRLAQAEDARRRMEAQAEEVRRRMETQADAALAEARARARELEGAAARAPSEGEVAELRARVAEMERRCEERRAANLQLERQLQEARRQADSARSRAEQLQGVFAVLGQLGLPPHTLDAVAAAAAMVGGPPPGARVCAPLASPLQRPWLPSPMATALSPTHEASSSPSFTAAAVTAAAAATVAAAAAATAGQNAAASMPAILNGLREQLAAALSSQQKQATTLPPPPQPPQQHHPSHYQQSAASPASLDTKHAVDGEVQALRRSLQGARAEVLVYRRKLEDCALRGRQQQLQRLLQRQQGGVDYDSAAKRVRRHQRTRSLGRDQCRTSSRRRRGSSAERDLGFGSDLDIGRGLDLDSVLDFDMGLDPDLNFNFDQQPGRRGPKRRGQRTHCIPGSQRPYDTEPGSCSYSDDDDDGGRHDTRRAVSRGISRRRRGSAHRTVSCSSGTSSSAGELCDSPRGRSDRRARRTPGSRDGWRGFGNVGGIGSSSGRPARSAAPAVTSDAVSEALRMRVQQLTLEAQMARSREARCLEAARRADAVILLLHGAASRAQLLLAGAPRRQDQDLADELADALARAMRHRQHIARLTVEAEAQGLPRHGGEGPEGTSGLAAGLQDPIRLKEWEQQQAAAATLAAQLAAARDEVAAAAKQMEELRSQLLQQAEAHAAEVATVRNAADAALAQASQLSSQLVDARAQQQALQREAQVLRRRLRSFQLQVRQLLDDMRQHMDLADLANFAKSVLAATERAFGLWTIREHDHVQATRRAVSELRSEAGEFRQLMQSFAAAQHQAIGRLTARCKAADSELRKLREQDVGRSTAIRAEMAPRLRVHAGAQEVATVKQRLEEQVRRLGQERELLETRVTALQGDKECFLTACGSLRQQLEAVQHALDDERRARVEAEQQAQATEGRMQTAISQAVRAVEVQRDAAQAEALAAEQRVINAVDERDKEARRLVEMEARMREQHEHDVHQLQDLQQRHEAALQELKDAQEVAARETAEQLIAANRWAQALQEQLLQRQGQLRQQQQEVDGLRTMLRDAEQQLQEALVELQQAHQRVEAAEAREVDALQRLTDAEAEVGKARDEAARQLVEARRQENAAIEARAEAETARAEALAAKDAALAAAKAAELDSARHLAEVQAAREFADSQFEAVQTLETQLQAARDGLRQAEERALTAECELQSERGAGAQLRQQLLEARGALAEAQEERGAAMLLRQQLVEARGALAEAQDTARMASQELLQAKERCEELQQDLMAAERRLEAARSAARMHEQQLSQEQQESDRLRCQLRVCQARVFELQHSAATQDVSYGRRRDSSGGGSAATTAGSSGAALDVGYGRRRDSSEGGIASTSAAERRATGAGRGSGWDTGTDIEHDGSRGTGSGGGLELGVTSLRGGQGVIDAGWLSASNGGAEQRPAVAAVANREEESSCNGKGMAGSGTGSGWGSFATSKASTPVISSGGGSNPSGGGSGHDVVPVASLSSIGGSAACMDGLHEIDPAAAAAVEAAYANGSRRHMQLHLSRPSVELLPAGTAPPAEVPANPGQLCSSAVQSRESSAASSPSLSPSHTGPPSPLAQSHQQATLPHASLAVQQAHHHGPLGDEAPTQLQDLLDEVARHCQRLPAINQVLDEMLLTESGFGDRDAVAPGSGPWPPSAGDALSGGPGSLGMGTDGFLRSPAAAAALEHLVPVLGDALKLVAQLEAVVAEAGGRETADMEAALSQHRRQLEATWGKIVQARRLIAAADPASPPLPPPPPSRTESGGGGSGTVSIHSYGLDADADLAVAGNAGNQGAGKQGNSYPRPGNVDHKENLAAALAAGAEALVGILWPREPAPLGTSSGLAAVPAATIPAGGEAVASATVHPQTDRRRPLADSRPSVSAQVLPEEPALPGAAAQPCPGGTSCAGERHQTSLDTMQSGSRSGRSQLQPLHQPSAAAAAAAAVSDASAVNVTRPAARVGVPDDTPAFRGFSMPSAGTSTAAPLTRSSDNGCNMSAPKAVQLEERAHSEPGASGRAGAALAALATARAELARSLLSPPATSPSNLLSPSSPPPLPLPLTQQQPHPGPGQRPSGPQEGLQEQLSQAPPHQPQRLSLADLVAPRRTDREWAESSSQSPPHAVASQNPSPEPRPRPLLLLPMPLSPIKPADVLLQQQPQQQLAPTHQRPAPPPPPPLLPPWLQRQEQQQQQPVVAQRSLQGSATRDVGWQQAGGQLERLQISFDLATPSEQVEQREAQLQTTSSTTSSTNTDNSRRSGDGGGNYNGGGGDSAQSVDSSCSSISLARGGGFPLRPAAPRSASASGAAGRNGTEGAEGPSVGQWALRQVAGAGCSLGAPQRGWISKTDGGSGPERSVSHTVPGPASISLSGLAQRIADRSTSAGAPAAGKNIPSLRSSYSTTASSHGAPSHDPSSGSPPQSLVADRLVLSPGRVGRYGSPSPRGGAGAATASAAHVSPSREASQVLTAPTVATSHAGASSAAAASGFTAGNGHGTSPRGGLHERPVAPSWERPLTTAPPTTSTNATTTSTSFTAAAGTGASPSAGITMTGDHTPTSQPQWRPQGEEHEPGHAVAPVGPAGPAPPPGGTTTAAASNCNATHTDSQVSHALTVHASW
ncbi:hypothetical protein VOLCADRAFT_119676, partial [Volvox carteri f. nagariensis]